MKYDCGETYVEKWDRLGQWHRWFAWRPVRVGLHDCRWWEYVERRITQKHWTYDTDTVREYRAIEV